MDLPELPKNSEKCQRALIDYCVPATVSHHGFSVSSSDTSCDKVTLAVAINPLLSDISCDKVAINEAETLKWKDDPGASLDDHGSFDSWENAAVVSDKSTDNPIGVPTEIIINLPDPPSPPIRTRLRIRAPKLLAAATPEESRGRSTIPQLHRSAPVKPAIKKVNRKNDKKEPKVEKAMAVAASTEGETAVPTDEQRQKLRKRVKCISYREDNITAIRQRTSSPGFGGDGLAVQREKVPCPKCNKLFEKRSLKLHLLKHSGERPHSCDVCHKSFISKYNVKLHRQRCHSDKKTFDCDLCRRTFSSKHAATEHRRTHTGEKPYRCRVCSREFSHMVFDCELCQKTFKHKRSLQKHAESVHQGIRKSHAYLCSTCGQSYDSHSKLKVHQYRHTGERPFKCPDCRKSFMTKDVLRNHALIHCNSKPFVCDVCGRGFRQSITFKRHCSVHTGIKPFSCENCKKQFIHRVYMAKHECYKTRRGGSVSTKSSKAVPGKEVHEKETTEQANVVETLGDTSLLHG